MQHSPKYIIHADIRTSGVVERSDVVGAIFGQTEGLLGEEMELRNLQDSSKVGRIDVDVDSEGGRSFGTIRIASGLDRAETAVLAAALETIERVGPCRSNVEVLKIEDARAAKRREIVDRATELLAEFEAEALTSDRLVEAVRERLRDSEMTEFHGLPAGPRVAESDSIIVVEGRADVRQLLSCGIKNAVAVEGTDIPDPVAGLTKERTTTAFLDGDRGGDLVLRELAQVGNVDYVAFAPGGKSVEDLDRVAITAALRKKIPYEQIEDGSTPREAFAPTDGGTVSEDPEESATTGQPDSPETVPESLAEEVEGDGSATEPIDGPMTLGDHVREVIGGDTTLVRLLDDSFETLTEAPAEEAFDTVAEAEQIPHTVVLDGTATQRLIDIVAQRGVGQVIAADTGEFVKQPASVRIHTAEELDVE